LQFLEKTAIIFWTRLHIHLLFQFRNFKVTVYNLVFNFYRKALPTVQSRTIARHFDLTSPNVGR
jgi:hypothetical protein